MNEEQPLDMEPQAAAEEDLGEPSTRPRRNRAVVVTALVLVILAVVAGIMWRSEADSEPEFAIHNGAVSDLLGWMPANDESRRAFAVWTDDPGLATPLPGASAVRFQGQLVVEPSPLTLGNSPAWRDFFGWDVDDVTGWATARLDSDLSVLKGEFDIELVTQRLRRAGYDHDGYRGVDIFVLDDIATPTGALDRDSVSAANAIAVMDGRLITSSARERVEAAIDVAIDGDGSLIDDATISGMIETMAPLSGLVAVDQAKLAADCDSQASGSAISEQAKSNYAMVGYGRLGEGGERRTMVSISYPDESAAVAASPDYERGWVDGFANAGGTGGSIATYGTLTVVTRTGRFLIAELVDGRDYGWVRAGIRYAIPVCEASMALALEWGATPVAAD